MRKIICFIICGLMLLTAATAQQIAIPYREKQLWGLADTNGKVIIKPLYDEIRTTDSYYGGNNSGKLFLVKKDGKNGLISIAQVIMAPKYNFLHVDSVFVVEHISKYGSGNLKVVLYNIRGERLLADTLREIVAMKNKAHPEHLLFVVVNYKKNSSGIIWYDDQRQVIKQWILKDVDYVEASYYDNGLTDLYAYMSGSDATRKLDMTFNAGTGKYEVKPATNNRHLKEVKGTPDDGSGFYGGEYNRQQTDAANFIIKTIQLKINGYNARLVNGIAMRNNTRWPKKDSVTIKLDADQLFSVNYVTEKVEGHNYNRKFTSVDTVYHSLNYLRFRKNKKWGILASEKIIPAEYDSIAYFDNGLSRPLFLVGKYNTARGKMNWGIRDALNKEWVPCVYDEIIRKSSGSFWITKKDGKYGLLNLAGRVEFEAKYDQIIPDIFYSSFQVIEKSKYGWISPYGKCPPVLPYPVERYKTIGNYTIFELKDSAGHSLGYGDKKGFVYFKP